MPTDIVDGLEHLHDLKHAVHAPRRPQRCKNHQHHQTQTPSKVPKKQSAYNVTISRQFAVRQGVCRNRIKPVLFRVPREDTHP